MGFPQTIVNQGSELMTGSPIVLFDSSDSTAKHREALIYFDELTGGGEALTIKTEIRRYVDDVYFQVDSQSVNGGMTNDVFPIAFLSVKGLKVTVTQVGGTMRNIKWEVHTI